MQIIFKLGSESKQKAKLRKEILYLFNRNSRNAWNLFCIFSGFQKSSFPLTLQISKFIFLFYFTAIIRKLIKSYILVNKKIKQFLPCFKIIKVICHKSDSPENYSI